MMEHGSHIYIDRRAEPDIYVSLVNSLYSSMRSLVAGAIGGTAAVLVTAIQIGGSPLYVCAAVIAVVGFVRVAVAFAFRRRGGDTLPVERPVLWDVLYGIGACAFSFLLGVWCYICLTFYDDVTAQLVAVSVTIGYSAGIAGRNAGRPQLVSLQILFACLPLVTGFVVHGETPYLALGMLLAFFFWSMRGVSISISETLLAALRAEKVMTLLAGRLEAALSSMSHGVLMIDADQKLRVYNQRALSLLGLHPEAIRHGMPIGELVQACVREGVFSRSELKRLQEEFTVGRTLQIVTNDRRTISLTSEPAKDGGVVIVAEDVTERKRTEARISYMAHHDDVTGLPNRVRLKEELEQFLRKSAETSSAFAVFCVDLDHFKSVNDTLGHPVGDSLLRATARRLASMTRKSDLLARFGGDEFVLLASGVTDAEQAEQFATRIITALSRPYALNGHSIVAGASVGVAFAPKDGSNADALIKNADMALYRAKANGRGTFCVFQPEMDVRAQERRSLEMELRSAFANEELQLYYQPLLNVRSRTISTCEALLRWPRAGRGIVSPGEFIPLAEEMGLIVEIGDWTLVQACRQAVQWPEEIRVAVNVSPMHFRRGDIVRSVEAALQDSGLPADRLEIEVTESVLLEQTERTRQALGELAEMGIRISLDDFGTGYSSLAYLQNYPFHKVKIDRSFLSGLDADPQRLIMLRGVARLSAELGLAVTLEGVERDDQLAIVMADGYVDEVQGFLISCPVPAEKLGRLFASRKEKQAAA
ncbi:diguanylate cyclase (GGDEF)-like protein [Rhodopseudomonas julia]|uniref:Diguanylate cyclase (GGDEF)-like protein n=1 Tax=Rhodopseudomonas julia TaxID=200617 RepID=A0ABU0C7V2_9BRAD|nr:EAL domain-containing protein [Rhodopseudomonas julia]MDQ0326001.1 diguanylate cyclase (GGDEF)-like protein [Rhodopseudomonas julia]